MSIDFACPKCKKQYRVKEELAGKGAKCAKCDHRIKIPTPAPVEELVPDDLAADDLFGDTGGSSWMDDELDNAASTSAAVPAQAPSKKCTACGSPLASGAVLCVACGFDTRSGEKHSTEIEKGPSKAQAAAQHTASLARGALFSSIGAAIGAAIWVAVVMFTGYEIGWIAWGLGAAAGVGMAFGHEDDDGTMAGIVAAGISILGIVGAKFIVFEQLKSKAAEIGLSLEALSALAGEEITFGSLFGPIDALFIFLAVGSAYKLGSGQMTD